MTNNSTKSFGTYVFEDIVDGVLLLACDGKISYINKRAQEILDISNEQYNHSLPGVWLKQMDSGNDELCQAILDALYNKEQKNNKTVSFYPPNGKKRILNIKSSYWKALENDDSDGVLLIIQDITKEECLKKEKDDAVLVFSFLITIVGIWTLFYASLTYFGIELPKFCMSYILLVLGMILSWFVFKKTDLSISDIGLSLKNIKKPVLVNVVFSLSAWLVMIVAKIVLIKCGSSFFVQGNPFFDFRFTLGMKLYPLSVLLQEFLSQSIIHECLMRILKSKHSAFHGILLSGILFTVLHIHRGFAFMVGSLLLVCLISSIYRKQRTIWGLCITHYSVTMMAYFLDWL